MCLVIFAFDPDGERPLAVAANRDEFHARPTAPAAFWPEAPGLLAGRDLEAGGTWMGVTRNGRFAAITNYRDPDRTVPAPRSRGALPLDFLLGEDSPTAYAHRVMPLARQYAGYNLLIGSGRELWYLCNTGGGEARPLPAGTYGLSNARLDTPWPKVVRGKAALENLLADDKPLTHNTLAAVVGDRTLADKDTLAQQGLNGEMDELLSAQFIMTPAYGTRSRTTFWRDAQGTGHWREQCFNAQGELTGTQDMQLAPE